ncbi:hypothetical protein D7Y44_19185 [Stenotrophomonas maltophilia]|nr:hypothetical protein [Stenotrophomonas maltophilia]
MSGAVGGNAAFPRFSMGVLLQCNVATKRVTVAVAWLQPDAQRGFGRMDVPTTMKWRLYA